MAQTADRTGPDPSRSAFVRAAVRYGLAPVLAAVSAAGFGGGSWSASLGVAGATLVAIVIAHRGQSDPGPAHRQVLALQQFCGVVSAQLGLAVATSEAGADQALRASARIQGLIDADAPGTAPQMDDLVWAVHQILAAAQHHDLLRQNLQAVQVALDQLKSADPIKLFESQALTVDQVLSDLREAYVMEAQRKSDREAVGPARQTLAPTPDIELF